MRTGELIKKLENGALNDKLTMLYGSGEAVLNRQINRYIRAAESFVRLYPEREDVCVFSAPGRTEIGGNHTDHQRGCALAAAVDLDVIAIVSFHDDGVIRLYSEGHDSCEVDLSDLSVREEEKGKSVSLIRGIASRFAEAGAKVGGFDAYTTSDVLSGSGLSSSAAFETLIGTIINKAYNNSKASEVEIAKIGQYAENIYFGKGSGLLDQTVCSVGGFVFLDFYDTENPGVEKLFFDFDAAGYKLCITDTKGSHSDLTEDYVAVPSEMKAVAACFGKEYLASIREDDFFAAIPRLHGKISDRAILRAIHFFGENRRAAEEAIALKGGDPEIFFELFRRSAYSSANYLQNLYSVKKPHEQGIPLALAVSRRILGGQAAVRVHGGGFAGTIQAFVPAEKAAEYAEKMNALFGEGSCHVVRIRPVGGIQII